MTEYIIVPHWREFKGQNRAYFESSVCPTLTTQCAHACPPLVVTPYDIKPFKYQNNNH